MDGITVETKEHGPNGWQMTLIAGLIAATGVVLAAAIWNMSIGLMVGAGAFGLGMGLQRTLVGLGVYVGNRCRGKAEIILAEGAARAQIADAETRRIVAVREVRQLTRGRE